MRFQMSLVASNSRLVTVQYHERYRKVHPSQCVQQSKQCGCKEIFGGSLDAVTNVKLGLPLLSNGPMYIKYSPRNKRREVFVHQI